MALASASKLRGLRPIKALLIVLASALFSTFSLIIACIVKARERFMGIGQFLTMPIFFASNAIYPITMMPPWLRAVARVNPLSYEVDALRSLMLGGGGKASSACRSIWAPWRWACASAWSSPRACTRA